MQTLYYHLIDLHQHRIYPAKIVIEKNRIVSIEETTETCTHYILPGLIDAHVHIESSMLIPSEFARLAVQHGTVATISDPHEIANVCGIPGVEYMLSNAKKVPLKIHFGAPSCVPATSFETAGAIIDAEGVHQLLQRDDIFYLSEMMNYPGVLFKDTEVMKKIEYAQLTGKPVDGHAPGLRGEQAKTYIDAGITTDHECTTYDEAAEKLSYGMKILIREGSAAKNFDALIDLLPQHWQQMMFCCDDKHPDELVLHHMNHHVKRALAKGMDLFKVLTVACINPIEHYKMDVGQLRVGDKADFIVIDNPSDFTILKTVIEGQTVYEHGEVLFPRVDETCINQFQCKEKSAQDFAIPVDKAIHQLRVIEALDGQLITRTHLATPSIEEGCIVSDPEHDILKMVIVNRYQEAPIAKAFIKNIGLKQGAIASTVAHDSHQLLCVGVNDEAIAKAVNALIRCQGGVAVVNDEQEYVLPLPVGGLMSNRSAHDVAATYSQLDQKAKEFGSQLSAPFMTLSFMALLVIPQLKLSDKGLFDGQAFQFVDLFE